ncbi:S8 family serine peptidase [Streptomyces sp. NPDC058872]|uniref:S8 family serine peptidase n=1 Tax=Streptomyces sp. NPDC058872 TaxID=3346661 RepID=UPI0036C97E16
MRKSPIPPGRTLQGVLLSTAVATALAVTTVGVASLASAAPADPAPRSTTAIQGLDAPERIADSYIVTLKDGQNPASNADRLAKKHKGKVEHVYREALQGFSLAMSENDARALAADPAVARVEANQTVSLIDPAASTRGKGNGNGNGNGPKPKPTPTDPTPEPTPTDPTPDPTPTDPTPDPTPTDPTPTDPTPDPTPTDPTPDPTPTDPTPTDPGTGPGPGDTQANPPSWGLDRIDQAGLPLDSSYAYPVLATNVHAYIIDTGIRTTHTDFGGRASWGTNTTGDGVDSDCQGHGTHVAGTVGGAAHGVAKGVNLVAVKVLNCSGSGTTAGVIAGIDWVTANAVKPAVANMSLGGTSSVAMNDAVARSTAAGISHAVAAGNENADACGVSPASAPSAITVGATTSSDARSSFSNFGTCLDIFAPGSVITSAWNTSDTATSTLNGTSMASPHVAGNAALILGQNPTWTPQQVRDVMVNEATTGIVTSPGTGSPNKLLRTTASNVANEFSMSLSSSSGAVTVGQSVTTDIATTIVRGEAENIAFTTLGMPRDATITLSPASVTAGGSSTVTIATTSATPNGTYPITIIGTSPSARHAVSYTLAVSGGPCDKGQKLVNPGFEDGATGWTASPESVITDDTTTYAPHTGQWYASLNGRGTTGTDRFSQNVRIPAGCGPATLNYSLRVASMEGNTRAWDFLRVQVWSEEGTLLDTLKTHTNIEQSADYVRHGVDLSPFADQTVMIRFIGSEDSSLPTAFLVDDVTLDVADYQP